jgi:hypothetical protein
VDDAREIEVRDQRSCHGLMMIVGVVLCLCLCCLVLSCVVLCCVLIIRERDRIDKN